jgi:5-oxoprolinase (ATP-hydrolysing) subunit A
MLKVDLNCDMGESSRLWPYSIEKDFALLDYLSSINIACGFHAGDIDTMKKLSLAASQKMIAIGAHPSFPDKENFGRNNMQLPSSTIYEIVSEQIHLLKTVLKPEGINLHHVKPHGALYNMSSTDPVLAESICTAIIDFDPTLILYGLSGGQLIRVGKKMGLRTFCEVFADRTYQEDGSLSPRNLPNALIDQPSDAAARALQMVKEGTAPSLSGKNIPIIADTICIHGDGPHALEFAKAIHGSFISNNITIRS